MTPLRPRGTLSEVALRAFRSPVSGLATMLAALASDLGASLTAAYLLPPGDGPVELVASGGPQAAALGPPGRANHSITTAVRNSPADALPGPCAPELASIPPWAQYSGVVSLCILLSDSFSCLLTAAGELDMDLETFYEASAPVGLLTQSVVSAREIERLRQELHGLKQDRSLWAASLQHDLRGPLTSIIGTALTLERRGGELDEETQRSLLQGLTAQGERLNRMLSETLEKHGATGAPVRAMQTDVKALVERVATAGSTARTGEVVVECDDVDIVIDPDRLERALLNLLDNALKYSPSDVAVHLIVETEGDFVNLTVADNGPGVSPEVLPGLFGAYMTDPARNDGIGLGLHSVHSLVKELGGRVGYSRHSDWTRFTISLPCAPRSIDT